MPGTASTVGTSGTGDTGDTGGTGDPAVVLAARTARAPERTGSGEEDADRTDVDQTDVDQTDVDQTDVDQTRADRTDVERSAPDEDDKGPLRLAVIVGSVRKGRFGPVVSDWFAEEARKHGGYELDVIDLADAEHELPVAFAEFGEPLPAPVKAVHSGLSRRLAAADAFVIVTPEYNHSFPAPLKNTIDWFRDEWQAKPAGFVSYGGMAGGQRAVEHLRQVFAELHAVTVRETLSFHMAWERFDQDGRPHDEEAGSAAARGMLRQLAWWGRALREARAKSPYGAAA